MEWYEPIFDGSGSISGPKIGPRPEKSENTLKFDRTKSDEKNAFWSSKMHEILATYVISPENLNGESKIGIFENFF